MSRNKNRIQDPKNPFKNVDNFAELESLEKDIRLLAKQLNRPITTIFSLLFFPVIAEILFLHPNSPLFLIYEKLHRQYYENFLMNLQRTTNAASEQMRYITGVRNWVLSKFSEMCYFKEFNPKLSPRCSVEEMAKVATSFLEPLQSKKIIEGLHSLRTAMLIVINVWRLQLRQPLLDISYVAVYSIYELYKLMEEAYHGYSSLDAIFAGMYADSRTLAEMDRWMIFLKTVLIFAGKYFVIDPIFNRLYPYGIFQRYPQELVQRNHLNISPHQIKQKIENLNKYKKELSQKAARNIMISRYLSVLILIMAFYYLIASIIPSSFTIVMAITLIGTALTNIMQDVTDIWRAYKLKNAIKNTAEKFENIFEDGQEIVQVASKNHLDSSYIRLDFGNKSKAKIFKNCLLFYSFGKNIFSHGNGVVNISAGIDISENKIGLIKELYHQTLAYNDSLKNLKKQFDELSNLASIDIIFQPDFDKHHLPFAHIELTIPENFYSFLKNYFERIFAANKISWIKMEDNNYVCTMEGHTNANNEEWKKFLQLMKQELKLLSSRQHSLESGISKSSDQSFLHSETKQHSVSNKRKKEKNEEENNNKKNDLSIRKVNDLPLAQEPRRTAKWKHGFYDSKDPHCLIYPIPQGKIINNKSISQTNKFIKNALNKDILRTDEIYNALDQLVQNPHIVCAKGQTGLVRSAGWATDSNGEWFPYLLKIKLFGQQGKGDIRFYAEAETNEHGDTLYVVKGVNYHAH